jgi:GntR family transcriptional regulator
METPEDVRGELGDDFAKSLYLKRLYHKDDQIFGFSHVFMPVELARTVTWDIAEKNSGYSLLTKHAGYVLKHANLSIRALAADEEQAANLRISEGEPVLCLSRTSYTTDDRPIEHLKLYLRSDISEFTIKVPGHFSIMEGIRKMQNGGQESKR